jgi:hypothetical protein
VSKRGGLTSTLREYMTPERMGELVAKLYDRAARLGDMRAAMEIFNRLEGPVASRPLEIPGGMEVQAVIGVVLRTLEQDPEARGKVAAALQKEAKKLEVKDGAG